MLKSYTPLALKKRMVKTGKAILDGWHMLSEPLYWLYEKRLHREVTQSGLALPKHIGMILDGNRRFAKQAGLGLDYGYDMGASKAEEVLEWCLELGIHHVTMWIFSTENHKRSLEEKDTLFKLFKREAEKMLANPRLHENRVKVKLIGDIKDFPQDVQEALMRLEEKTKDYDAMLLNIAVGYGGREEITYAVRHWLEHNLQAGKSLEEVKNTLSPEVIERYLYTAGSPDPDFVIRTSGEIRLSGFLLWQSAYSEYYFCDVFWPSFRRLDFLRALRNFQARQRRFGQ
ncbi:MAG: polyprenyl diphosphate synthase [Deinococcales bacterium]